MFEVTSHGSFSNTEKFLKSNHDAEILSILNAGGLEGVLALRLATPVESGRTASSWDFVVSKKRAIYTLTFTNNDVENGFPVAVMLQYGYGTGTGGYVQGTDYINPALKPIFDKIQNDIWKAVTSL